jgi:hypothetical protein
MHLNNCIKRCVDLYDVSCGLLSLSKKVYVPVTCPWEIYFDFAEANVIQRIAELWGLEFCTCRGTRSQARKGTGWMPEGLGAEEGRGERRNVTGELQASDEPVGPEWGNLHPCERMHRRLNA